MQSRPPVTSMQGGESPSSPPFPAKRMSLERIVGLALLLIVIQLPALSARADCNGPKTLLHWNCGKTSDDDKSALDEPLETDRPDFTESPKTVGAGVIQLEGGYTFTTDKEDGVRTTNHSFPETLLRIGAWADWLEFRIDWNYEVQETRAGGVTTTASGADDLGLGIKLALTEQQCCLPTTGIILQMSVPTGGDAFTADQVLPGVEYCYSWDLTKDWSLSGMTACEGAVDDTTNDTYVQFSQSLSLDHSWNDRVRSYTEWYVLSPISADTNPAQNYFNGGFTVLINNNIQWDIRAGVGLNEGADDFFAGSGLSLRYY